MHPQKHLELVEEDTGSDDKPGPSNDVTKKSVQLTPHKTIARYAPFQQDIVEMAPFSLDIVRKGSLSGSQLCQLRSNASLLIKCYCYGRHPSCLPDKYVRGKLSVDHNLSCSCGSFPSLRHNKIEHTLPSETWPT